MNIEIANFQVLAEEVANNSMFDHGHKICMHGLQFKYIGGGSYREVYRIQDLPYVVKIGNRRANRTEFRHWRCASPRHRRFLARVRACSQNGKVLIMEYIPSVSLPHPSDELAALRRIERILPKSMTWDGGSCNLRFTKKGWPKLVDYQSQIEWW